MKSKTFICVLTLLIFGITGLQAQHALPATGSGVAGDQGSLSVTAGQFSYGFFSDASGEINEGIQQPYEIYVITDIENADMFHIQVYPNPASRMIILRSNNSLNKVLKYQLLDNNGRLLKAENITGELYIIPIQQFEKGIYYLNVISGSRALKSFKIVKNE